MGRSQLVLLALHKDHDQTTISVGSTSSTQRSRSTTISVSSTSSTQRWDQRSSDKQSRHLVRRQQLDRCTIGVASKRCLANYWWDVWKHGRTNIQFSWYLSISKNRGSVFRALRISQLRILSPYCHALNSSQISRLCRLHLE